MRSDDDGMVTAELAVCLPVLVLLLAVALGAVSVAGARLRVTDVAREAARLAARDDNAALGQLIGHEAPRITITVKRTGGQVVAVASEQAGLVGSSLSAVTVSATSVAAVEPTGVP